MQISESFVGWGGDWLGHGSLFKNPSLEYVELARGDYAAGVPGPRCRKYVLTVGGVAILGSKALRGTLPRASRSS